MSTAELQALATAFHECAEALRRLGDSYPSPRCIKVLVAANLAADYADRAAADVEDEIMMAEIAAEAQEELSWLVG